MSLAIVVTVFVGFAPSYYLRGFFDTEPLSRLVHFHGAVLTGWILLFLTQTTLVARHRTDLHRRLGIAGAVLAIALVVVSVPTAVAAARRDAAMGSEDALSFLAIGISDVVVFAILVSLGILSRRRVETHKRLMLLATVCILDAAVGRWPFAIMSGSPLAFSLWTDLFVVAGCVYDLASRGRVHPAYLWGGLLIVVAQVSRIVLAGTGAWLAIARALVQ